MKKLLVLVGVLCLSILSYGGIDGNLQNTVLRQTAAQQQTHSLYTVVSTQLQQYYGRTNFQDTNHKTGWYRVDDFLTWLKTNETQLAQEIMFILDNSNNTAFPRTQTISLQEVVNRSAEQCSPALMRAFWINLGIHYVAGKYQAGVHLNPISFEVVSDGITSAVGPSYFQINTKDPWQVFLIDLNIGIHEGTHNLFYVNQTMQAKAPQNREAVLSELATFYSQYHYSLPIKIADGKTLPSGGVRYLPKSYQAYPDFSYQLEYQQFVMGPLVAHKMTLQQVLTLFDDPFQPDVPVWESVFIFLAAKNNHYLSVDLDATSHQMRASSRNLVSVARQFGFTQTDTAQWINDSPTFIDLGKRVWPGTNSQENVILWKRARAQEFIFIGEAKRYSAQDFLKMTFGPYSQEPKLIQFYDELLKVLPPAVKQVQAQQYPTIIAGQTLTAAYQSAVAPYREQWISALVKTLEKVGITKAPVVPQGYL